ncbi:PREDICTED: uncharacterized protein LOC109231644 [Nicotiana attenuata]|uniref:uncharacterized protein LOC109231644 n=1 Tax=Nicotiana attenuata TaxID=49451 RepID=UPI0009054D24|nr:PREDICTED: uncharacterized protein LOC109231644 [Nicotiana attenuata]
MDINDNKAPRCDGYNSFFFQKTWHILGDEVTAAVIEFFNSADMCKAINYTTITMMPKVMNPTTIKEFRPISYYFVQGRLITNNIIMSHELVKGYGSKSISPRCMLKIDMQKAYDSIERVYIEQVMKLLGFPKLFAEWIIARICTVSYSVVINGKPVVPFEEKKRAEAGLSLYPFWFVMAMEYLRKLLKPLKDNKIFKFHPKCAKVNLVQLGFTDDFLLFYRGDLQSVKILHHQFQIFSASLSFSCKSKQKLYFTLVE